MDEPVFLPLGPTYDPGCPPEQAAREFHEILSRRRSIRAFSDQPVSKGTVEWIISAATSAPNGANKQPWRFVAVSDPAIKHQIRLAAEEEERALYGGRASEEWLEDLAPLGTDDVKEYLDLAPWLIIVFRLTSTDEGGKTYYSNESLGIATGMLLAAAQFAGLSTLTHTPSPMRFLAELLGRPAHEKPYMLIPLGYPADDCTVPAHAIERKPLEEVLLFDPTSSPTS
ncbi:MAG: nitroreductase family protein [Planctomycetota bacterium]